MGAACPAPSSAVTRPPRGPSPKPGRVPEIPPPRCFCPGLWQVQQVQETRARREAFWAEQAASAPRSPHGRGHSWAAGTAPPPQAAQSQTLGSQLQKRAWSSPASTQPSQTACLGRNEDLPTEPTACIHRPGCSQNRLHLELQITQTPRRRAPKDPPLPPTPKSNESLESPGASGVSGLGLKGGTLAFVPTR